MQLDITATTQHDPLQRAGFVQVRLKAVALRDDGTPYRDAKGEPVFVEREAIRPGSAEDAAKSLALEWKPKAQRQLMTALIALDLETAPSEAPKVFKVS